MLLPSSSLSSLFLSNSDSQSSVTRPLYNVQKTSEGLIVTYEVPGYEKSDLDLKFEPSSGILTLTGLQEVRPHGEYLVERIRPRTKFVSTLAVKSEHRIESATHRNGLLVVTLKNMGGEPPGQSIPIS